MIRVSTIVWSLLRLDILKCEVKWALGSITMNKASGSDGIPAELLKIQKDDAVKSAAHNMSANLQNSAEATRLEKVSFISIPKEGNAKECSNYCATVLISHSSKVSTLCELRTSRCTSWVSKRQRKQITNCQQSLDHGGSKRVPEKHLLLFH